MMDLSVVPYKSRPETDGSCNGNGNRYRECMRNHAASLGGHAFDGCGEFMPSDVDADPLKCAACGCHRSFHRLLLSGDLRHRLLPPPPPPPFYTPPPPPAFSRFPPVHDSNRSDSGTPPPPQQPPALQPLAAAHDSTRSRSGSRKRMRTKFTAEQKEKMQAFAERNGWRMQKQDEGALEEFCVEIGVTRHVLKVWMHNNKSHLATSAAAASGGKVETAAAAAAANAEGISV